MKTVLQYNCVYNKVGFYFRIKYGICDHAIAEFM